MIQRKPIGLNRPRSRPTPPAAEQARVRPTRAGLLGDYFSTLALTLTNPVTILAFLGIFAALWYFKG